MSFEADISPGLRAHIAEAAQAIRAHHDAELADPRSAEAAVRLFSSIVHPSGASEASPRREESLSAEFGALVGDAVRTGTDLLTGPLASLAEEWISSLKRSGQRWNAGASRGETPRQDATQSEAESEAASSSAAPPPPPADEENLRSMLRRFTPMLVFSVKQGGTGYALAEQVIRMFGRSAYDQAAVVGKDRILEMLASEPDLWSQVAPVEAKFKRFLEEFLTYDVWKASTVER